MLARGPIRKARAPSLEPTRPTSAPRPASFTGRTRTRSSQPRARPSGPSSFSPAKCSDPVALSFTVSPALRSIPVSVQSDAPETSSSFGDGDCAKIPNALAASHSRASVRTLTSYCGLLRNVLPDQPPHLRPYLGVLFHP